MDYYASNRRPPPSDARGYRFDDMSKDFDHPHRTYRQPRDDPDLVDAFRETLGARNSDSAAYGTRRVGRRDANLDDFDRALMAEPRFGHNNSSSTARLSLPTHHARSNYSSSPFFDPSQTQGRQTNDGQSSMLSATRLPSSPPVGYPPSSPTYRIQQRSNGQRAYPLAPSPTRTTSKPAPNVGKARADFGSRRRIINRSHTPSRMRRQLTPASSAPLRANQHIELQDAPQSAHGIQLISAEDMPDRFRSIFPPLFNAIQSRCYPTAFESDHNLVLSAPTGGGKTVVLEMAICRLISTSNPDQFKIVYMAPTKSLCSERHRDWQAKLANLNLQSAELTGDTDNTQLRNVQSANLIVTTPEKWDSMTRKWKDHAKLMKMVKLFLIDEVHILKDSRGATLEAVVSRMKSIGTSVRFVALSATVPNSEDIATWLGRDHANPGLPAVREIFGEEFRPVKLEKHVVGIPYRGNEFGFEKACDPLLPGIIAKYSRNKPIMIFCFTKASCVNTAKVLSNLWAAKPPAGRLWAGPSQALSVYDRDLKDTIPSGVAFHHGGLDGADRQAIERGYLNGQVNVICCTSTLAVGVNLPCHFVIIKNTVTYQEFNVQEYSDLEVMQMMGRAGRPQFGNSAVAVIITKQEKYAKYEKLVSGNELLESCLHLNLIEHLNAEIGLGTVYNIQSAKGWLAGTFLYVRMGKNPAYYEIDDCHAQSHLEEKVAQICERDLGLLKELDLVSSDANEYLKTTGYGDAMTRYFVKYETMRTILGLEYQPKTSDLLSALVQADEYRDIRLRANEKKLYRTINRHNGIKFSIKVDIAIDAHKRSLMLQMELGGVDYPLDEEFAKHRHQNSQDKVRLFASAERLIRCIIACEAEKQDAVGLRRALELSRSLSARAWDSSPFQMKQLPQIGIAAIRKLAIAGITCIEDLEAAEPSRIEMLLNKNPPFGSRIVASAQAFPRLRAGIKMTGKALRHERLPIIKFMVEWSFMNNDPPASFQRRPIYVELVIERSDGYLVDYQKIPVTKSKHGSNVLLSAEMMNDRQFLSCYVMCSEIAGTLRHAELKPELQSTSFPRMRTQKQIMDGESAQGRTLAKSRDGTQGDERNRQRSQDNEFDDNDLDEDDLMNVDGAHSMFTDVDDFGPAKDCGSSQLQEAWAPGRLANGKWACNHKCKDKQGCKHLCCREGVDKAPKPPKKPSVPTPSLTKSSYSKGLRCKAQTQLDNRQSTLVPRAGKKGEIERLDLASTSEPKARSRGYSKGFRDLESLHQSTINDTSSPSVPSKKRASDSVIDGNCGPLTCLHSTPKPNAEPSSDFGEEWDQDLPSFLGILEETEPTHTSGDGNGREAGSSQGSVRLPASVVQIGNAAVDPQDESDLPQYDAEFSDTEQALVGLSDSISLQRNLESELGSGSCPKPPEFRPPDVPSDRLFLSSSGPVAVPQSSHKRASDEATNERLSPAEPDLKRLRTDRALNTPYDLPQQAEQVPEAPLTSIKPGLPKWAYELDPALIAEYQDIVDFV